MKNHGGSIPVTGIIFDIKKFAINDGTGIRTAVFLKGCPLRCLWYHNPESQKFEPVLSFSPEKCIGCGFRRKACPQNCISPASFVRCSCRSCGACCTGCHTGARELVGRTVTVEDVMKEVRKDRSFYENSGGDLTLSGANPLAQFEFARNLLIQAKYDFKESGSPTTWNTPAFRWNRF